MIGYVYASVWKNTMDLIDKEDIDGWFIRDKVTLRVQRQNNEKEDYNWYNATWE